MAQPLIQPSFAAGEIAPSLYSRVDLAKYHVGAALLRNFFVDYRGGAANRPGTRFVGNNNFDPHQPRLIPFVFSTIQAYGLLFINFGMKVVMNGGFVADPNNPGQDLLVSSPYAAVDLALLKFTQSADVLTITHPGYPPTQLTRSSHTAWTFKAANFVPSAVTPTNVSATPSMTGDGTGYSYVVTVIASNGVTESLPSAFTGSSTAADSKTMSTTLGAHVTITWDPVPGAQLYNVYRSPEVPGSIAAQGQFYGFVGSSNSTSFVDSNIAPDFSRTPPQNFNPFPQSVAQVDTLRLTSPGLGFTSQPTVSFSGPGTGAAATAFLGYAETNIPTANGTGYVVGDLIFPVGGTHTRPCIMKVAGFSPVDGNAYLQVIDTGEYTVPAPATVAFGATNMIPTVGGTGTGMLMYPIWSVEALSLDNGGQGYSSVPTVTISGGGASFAATAVATIVTTPPNNPSCTTYFQQRQVFAASTQGPQTFWMSKSGDYLNFGFSTPSRADDSIIGTIAGQQVNAIKHMVPMTSLIMLSSSGAYKVDAGQPGSPITPSSIQAVPQAYNGCSDVPPIVVNYDILYVQAKGSVVRDLAYNFYVNIYTGADMTTLANHLFFGHQITEWAYAEEPFKIVWAIRDDGTLLSFTFLKEQDVYAWTHHDTKGKFRSVCSIPEGNEDAVYFVVERYIQGVQRFFVERLASRNMGAIPEGVPQDLTSITRLPPVPTVAQPVPADLTRAWFVDCGLQYPLTYPNATLTPAQVTGNYSIATATVVEGGSGYVNPVAVITDATGSAATLSLTVVGGVITGVAIGASGMNFTNPTVTVTDSAGVGGVIAVGLSNDVVMSASASVFQQADVGAMVRVNNGWGTVRVVTNGQSIVVNVLQPLTSTWPAASGQWSCTRPVSSVSGLSHLEGETVSILADGNVNPQQRVFNGAIALDQPASAIVVGLPFTAQLQSLYIDTGEMPTMQGKRKKIPAVTVRIQDSRGFKVGPDFAHLDEPKERNFQAMGSPILPFTGDERVVVNSDWTVQGQVCVQQDQPLPCTILGLIPELTVGDTAQ